MDVAHQETVTEGQQALVAATHPTALATRQNKRRDLFFVDHVGSPVFKRSPGHDF